jgi:phosphoserine phosphatase RsbU/P
MRRLPSLLFLALCLSASAGAQTFDLDKDHWPVMSIQGLWRFHSGDDPSWANPKFDDSGWSLLESNRDWYTQGFKGYSGMGWYRFKIVLPGKIQNASFTLPSIYSSSEVFADGILVGTYGKMPPHYSIYGNGQDAIVYTIPSFHGLPEAGSRSVCIAIRVWMWQGAASFRGGGPDTDGGIAGETSQVEAQRDLNLAQDYWQATSYPIISLLQAFASLGAFWLFLFRRKEFEYLWFSLAMISSAMAGAVYVSATTHSWNMTQFLILNQVLSVAGVLCFLGFLFQLLQPRPTSLLRVAVLCALVEIPNTLPEVLLPDALPPKVFIALGYLLYLPATVWILIVLISTAIGNANSKSRTLDARLLLIPFVVESSIKLYSEASTLSWEMGLHLHFYNVVNSDIVMRPFPISVSNVGDALFLLGIFAVLVVRFTRTRGEEERYASEVEGARHVQQFLIPEDLPKIPGLIFESDYRPAHEVGGDFFQVVPNPDDGSALILVGDVAGKGMQAGMLATLLVGSMRTAATFTRDPAIILSTLNNRLHGNGNATCLALRIEANGAATLANAGHLPPYLNGQQLPMEGALPLGTIPNIDFPILQFHVNPGDILTLISDGILEAQKPDGELFGFDRIIEHLATSTAASTLASAAHSFGQSDDITVLTIARVSFAVDI